MPAWSKVMRTSIVAVGFRLPFVFIGFVTFGAKADDRSVAILILSHVVVIESWKSLVRRVSQDSSARERDYHTGSQRRTHHLLSADLGPYHS